MAQNSRLGRGLSALIPDKGIIGEREVVQHVPISQIVANPHQPRKHFGEKLLVELADSIVAHGVIQPLVVRKLSEDQYELIAGERRLRASRLAGLQQVPVVIRDIEQQQQIEMALVENVQRVDLNPLEEAITYEQLKTEFNLGLKAIAKRVGKQVSTISNKIRLLQLPSVVQEGLWEEKISEGHARALLPLEREELIEVAYGQILKDKLSVRATEELVAQRVGKPRKKSKKSIFEEGRSEKFTHFEKQLMEKLGTKVRITSKKGQGAISLSYYSDEELERLVRLLDSVKDL